MACEERSSLSTHVLASFLLSPGARELNSLTITNCDGCNDALMECLSASPCRKSLESLNIAHSSVTDTGLMLLVARCPELGVLDIQEPEGGQVTDKFIDFLAQTTHCLSFVNCWGCSNISSRAAAAFAKSYPDAALAGVYAGKDLGKAKSTRPPHRPLPLPEDVDE